MSKLLRGVLMFAVLTAAIWVAVLWHWAQTHRNMTVADIVVYLGLLPITVFALGLALRWAWRGAPERQQRKASLAAATGAAPSASTSDTQDEQRNQAITWLLGAHVLCPAGASCEAVLAAAAAAEPRPGLDEQLRDADGLPVMSARLPDLDEARVSEALTPVLAGVRAQQAEWANLQPAEHVVRALAALCQPFQEALDDLQQWETHFGVLPDGERVGSARPETGKNMVRVMLGVPSTWQAFEQALALNWLRWLVSAEGATRISITHFLFQALPCAGEELVLQAEQLLHMLAHDERLDLVLLAACHSDISVAAVNAMEREQRLFSAARHPKGSMPGEAAAVLILAPADFKPEGAPMDLPPVQLHRPVALARELGVDTPGRVSSVTLTQALQAALSCASLKPAEVLSIVCDADQHSPRGTELFGATLQLFPQLAPVEDMRLLGVNNGHTGSASALLVVAAAAEQARSEDHPCMALSLGDPLTRLALVACPVAPHDQRGRVNDA